MKITRLRPAVKDRRGTITDILDGVPQNSVTIITSKKGAVRGNHVHKRTVQWTYLLSGRVRYVSRKGNGKVKSAVMRPGDLAESPAGEAHTIVTLADCAFLAISRGPRHGKSYESDTFRLTEPLVRPR